MSSLQKFHRRTNPYAVAPIVGSGTSTKGYYLGFAGDGSSYMYVSPKSTEVTRIWGSSGTVRGTTSLNDGFGNTNTLYSFGSAAHPAAYYCKTLTLGGYNTWYLPAINEMVTMNNNKGATPFATANGFGNYDFCSSTESTATAVKAWYPGGNSFFDNAKTGTYGVRAVRRSLI